MYVHLLGLVGAQRTSPVKLLGKLRRSLELRVVAQARPRHGVRAACPLGAALAVLAVAWGAEAADPTLFPAAPYRSEDAPLGMPHAEVPVAPAAARFGEALPRAAPNAEVPLALGPVEPRVDPLATGRATLSPVPLT